MEVSHGKLRGEVLEFPDSVSVRRISCVYLLYFIFFHLVNYAISCYMVNYASIMFVVSLRRQYKISYKIR